VVRALTDNDIAVQSHFGVSEEPSARAASFGDETDAVAALAIGATADQGDLMPMDLEFRAGIGEHSPAIDKRVADHNEASIHFSSLIL